MLDYVNTQILIIGHEGNTVEKATVQQGEDQEKHKDTPIEEIEKLEHEDELRVEHLKGKLVVLQLDHKIYTDASKVMILYLMIWA